MMLVGKCEFKVTVAYAAAVNLNDFGVGKLSSENIVYSVKLSAEGF